MSNIKPLALQLYSVREALAEDFEGTVRRVANMGYLGVEPYGGMPGGLAEAASLFSELDLAVFNSHVSFPDDANRDAMLEVAEAFNLSRVTVSYMPPAEFETLDGIKRVCEGLNGAAELAKSHGLALGYHNHWWEFKRLDGQMTLDLMLDELDDGVFLEMDAYWVQVGGLDAVEAVRSAGERAPLIHLKDGSLNRDDAMLAVGSGAMPTAAVIEAAADTAEWHIVELDRCDSDMLQAVQDSYVYLTSNGLAQGRT